MERLIIIIFYLVCISSFSHIQAQHNKNHHAISDFCSDTIICKEYSLSIKVPVVSYKHKCYYQYDEGFYMLYPYQDSAYLFIHKGYNVLRPFCDTNKIKSTFENDTLKHYYGIHNNLFFNEIYYKERQLTISFVNVRKEDVLLFDNIIQSLNFFTKDNE